MIIFKNGEDQNSFAEWSNDSDIFLKEKIAIVQRSSSAQEKYAPPHW